MTIVIFGDSIAHGQHVSPHLSWVHLMSTALPQHRIVDASYNGDTTRLALIRMAHDVPHADLTIIAFGLNDAAMWDGYVRVSPRAFAANLHEIASRCRRVIFLTNHRTNKDPAYDSRVLRYNELIREGARELDAPVVDMEHANVALLDGIHPTAEGHAVYAESVLQAIQ